MRTNSIFRYIPFQLSHGTNFSNITLGILYYLCVEEQEVFLEVGKDGEGYVSKSLLNSCRCHWACHCVRI